MFESTVMTDNFQSRASNDAREGAARAGPARRRRARLLPGRRLSGAVPLTISSRNGSPASRSAPSTPRSSPATSPQKRVDAAEGILGAWCLRRCPGIRSSHRRPRPRSLFNEASAALIATFGVPGFFTPRIPPAPLWPQGSPQSQSYYDTAPLRKTLERLVDFDRINDLKTPAQRRRGRRDLRQFQIFRQFRVQEARQENRPRAHHGVRRAAAGLSLRSKSRASIIGTAASPPTRRSITCWTRRPTDDLLIFQVDLFSARGPLPMSLLEAAEREKDIRYSSRTRMNTDKNKQIHNARKAVRDADRKIARRSEERSVGDIPARGRQGKHRHGGAPDLSQQELRILFQGLRLLACRHGRALGGGRARRSSVDASQGLAGTAAIRRNHGDLRSHGGRHRIPPTAKRSE